MWNISMMEVTRAIFLSPQESWRLLSEDAGAVLIDVRTQPEWAFVGLPELYGSLGKNVLPPVLAGLSGDDGQPGFCRRSARRGPDRGSAAVVFVSLRRALGACGDGRHRRRVQPGVQCPACPGYRAGANFTVTLASDRPQGNLIVRLGDGDGAVTDQGMLNLCHRGDHETPRRRAHRGTVDGCRKWPSPAALIDPGDRAKTFPPVETARRHRTFQICVDQADF